ncbi:hypothetical protein H4219_003255 [Mycoemilia scoparia]|uniref:Secreted protein n=1 Tax=Mycoemilia scoparia TaxID=417184 RepID=A0A9W8A3A4_9FUNG|nr:hypothetical protein H4219_003255 [Mycoemilia scoparia]
MKLLSIVSSITIACLLASTLGLAAPLPAPAGNNKKGGDDDSNKNNNGPNRQKIPSNGYFKDLVKSASEALIDGKQIDGIKTLDDEDNRHRIELEVPIPDIFKVGDAKAIAELHTDSGIKFGFELGAGIPGWISSLFKIVGLNIDADAAVSVGLDYDFKEDDFDLLWEVGGSATAGIDGQKDSGIGGGASIKGQIEPENFGNSIDGDEAKVQAGAEAGALGNKVGVTTNN